MANTDQVIVDLSNYKDKVGSRVAEGRYRVVVEDAELDKSSAGNQMINLWLRIVGGEYADATIVDRLVLTEKSLFRVVGFMQAIGLPTPKKRLQVNLRSWIGKTLMIDVADGDPYNGRVKSEVRGYEKARAAAADDEGGDALDKLLDPEQLAGLEEFKPDRDDLREGLRAVDAGVPGRDPSLEVPDEVDLDSLNL